MKPKQLADKVGIMDNGTIVVEGAPSELINKMGADNVQIIGNGNHDAFCKNVELFSYVESLNQANGIIQVGVDSGNRRLVEIIETANRSDFNIEDIFCFQTQFGGCLFEVYRTSTTRQIR